MNLQWIDTVRVAAFASARGYSPKRRTLIRTGKIQVNAGDFTPDIVPAGVALPPYDR
jgi:hypothetical protein